MPAATRTFMIAIGAALVLEPIVMNGFPRSRVDPVESFQILLGLLLIVMAVVL